MTLPDRPAPDAPKRRDSSDSPRPTGPGAKVASAHADPGPEARPPVDGLLRSWRHAFVEEPSASAAQQHLTSIMASAIILAHDEDEIAAPAVLSWRTRVGQLMAATTAKIVVGAVAATATTTGLAASGALPKPVEHVVQAVSQGLMPWTWREPRDREAPVVDDLPVVEPPAVIAANPQVAPPAQAATPVDNGPGDEQLLAQASRPTPPEPTPTAGPASSAMAPCPPTDDASSSESPHEPQATPEESASPTPSAPSSSPEPSPSATEPSSEPTEAETSEPEAAEPTSEPTATESSPTDADDTDDAETDSEGSAGQGTESDSDGAEGTDPTDPDAGGEEPACAASDSTPDEPSDPAPTGTPTQEPSDEPSDEPTNEPSSEPSPTPTSRVDADAPARRGLAKGHKD